MATGCRQDANGLTRYATVELIVDRAAVTKTPSRVVGVRIALDEGKLQRLARSAGAKWGKPARFWRMHLSVANALGLADRVVELRTKPRLALPAGC